jgi:hypothetical protein
MSAATITAAVGSLGAATIRTEVGSLSVTTRYQYRRACGAAAHGKAVLGQLHRVASTGGLAEHPCQATDTSKVLGAAVGRRHAWQRHGVLLASHEDLPRPALAKHRQYVWGTRVPSSAFFLSMRTGRSPTASYSIFSSRGGSRTDRLSFYILEEECLCK